MLNWKESIAHVFELNRQHPICNSDMIFFRKDKFFSTQNSCHNPQETSCISPSIYFQCHGSCLEQALWRTQQGLSDFSCSRHRTVKQGSYQYQRAGWHWPKTSVGPKFTCLFTPVKSYDSQALLQHENKNIARSSSREPNVCLNGIPALQLQHIVFFIEGEPEMRNRVNSRKKQKN